MAAATKRHGLLGTFILSGILLVALVLSLACPQALAATYYWDADAAVGNGTAWNGYTFAPYNAANFARSWNTTDALWWSGISTAEVAWNNTTNATDTAVFGGGTYATVNVGTVNAGGLLFSFPYGRLSDNATGQYTLTGGTITLSGSGGAAGTIQTSMIGNNHVAMNSALAGTNGITFSGVGSITLGSANTFTGGMIINGGVVRVSAADRLNGNAITLNNGSIASGRFGALGGLYIITNDFTATGNLTTGSNGGVLDVANGRTFTLGNGAGLGLLSTGAGALYKTDSGVLMLNNDNSGSSFSGGIIVNGGQIRSNTFNSASANPFGNSSASYTLNAAGSLYAQSAFAGAAPATLGSLTASGGNMLVVDASNTGANNIALTFNQLVRSGKGTLIVDAIQSNLGTAGTGREKVFFTGTAPTTYNGSTMIAPWAVYTPTATANTAPTFLTYGASGLAPAAFTVTGLSTAGATSIVDVTGADTSLTAAGKTVYALRTSANITTDGVAAGTLTIGDGVYGGLLINGAATIGSATAASKVTVDFGTAEGVIFTRDGQTGVIANVLAGSNGITKFGNGTLTLGLGALDTNANTYSGTFRVNGGTLNLSKGPGIVAINGDLVIGPGANINSVTGTKGQVTFTAGSGQIAAASNVTLLDGSDLNLNAFSNTIASLTYIGSGRVQTGAGTLTLGGDITATSGNNSALNNADYAELNGLLSLGGVTRTMTVNAGPNSPAAFNMADLQIAAVISNGGLPTASGITKEGNGQLYLSAANTFTGAVTINAGTVKLGNALALGTAAAGTTVASGGTLDVNGQSPTAEALTLNGAGVNSGGALVNYDNNATANTWGGTTNLNTSSTVGVYGTRILSLGGIVSGGGNLTKVGAGALELSNVGNNFTGQITIKEGSLQVKNGAASMGIPAVGNEPILLGDTSGTASACLRSAWDVGFTTSRALTVQAGSSGAAMLGYGGNGRNSITLNGAITLNKDLFVITSSEQSSSNTYFGASSTISGPGGLLKTALNGGGTYYGNYSLLYYQNAATPTHAFTKIYGGGLRWERNTTTTLPTGDSVSFGTGDITLASNVPYFTYTPTNGLASFTPGGFQPADFELYSTQAGTDNNAPVTLTNAIHVSVGGGGLYGWQSSGANKPNITFFGAIDLAGPLTFGSRSTGGGGNAMHYTGTVTIDQQTAGPRSLQYNNASVAAQLEGNIVDGAGNAGNPLVIRRSNAQFDMRGTANTYAAGTIIETSSNLVNVLNTSSLGGGNAIVLPGSSLRLNGASNIASGKTVFVAGNDVALGVLGLNDALIDASVVDSKSGGVLALDTPSYWTNLSMASLGNGTMRLGSTTASGTYTGTALTVGTGNIYRLGGGGGTLTISGTNNVLTGTGASIEVGAGATGGAGTVMLNGSGTVILSNANNYTGSTTVNVGSTLRGVAQDQSVDLTASPFGTTTGVNLNSGGAIALTGASSGTTTNVGILTVNGWGKVGVTVGGSGNTVLNASSLSMNTNWTTRASANHHEVLIVDSSVNGTTSQVTLGSTTGMPVIDGSNPTLPGAFIVSNNTAGGGQGDFAMYGDAGKTGFSAFTGYTIPDATWSTITLGASGGTQVVNNSGVTAALTASTNYTVYGLRMGSQNLTGGVAGTFATVNVGPGGIIFTNGNGNIATNVAFGANEGFIYTTATGGQMTTAGTTLTGSNGLTISGPGTFSRAGNPGGFNGIAGPVTVHQATLTLDASQVTIHDYANYVMDGATVKPSDRFDQWFDGQITILGGGFNFVATVAGTAGTTPFNGKITGSGAFNITPNLENIQINNSSNDYQGGTVVGGMMLDQYTVGNVQVAAGSKLGGGSLVLATPTIVTLLGTGNLATTANVTMASDSILNMKAAGTWTLAGIEGGGNIVLGTTSGTSTLVVGDSNDRLFYGPITYTAGGIAGLTKVGSGTLTLAGLNTYTGNTTVSVGKIQLLNGVSLQNTPVSVSPTNGLIFTPGLTAVSLGALSGADNFALQDQAGSPAAVALTIGGTNLSAVSTGGLTGSGSLTKAGTGIQALGGTNNYSGATTVSGGTLRGTSTTAFSLTSGVSVATGGNLDFASGSGGTMNVGSGGLATLSLATGSGIGAEVGGKIKVGAVTATGSPAVKVNVYGSPAVAAPSGSYTLVEASSGLTSGGATYALGNVYNNTNFTLSAPSATDTSISVTATPVAALTTAFFKTGTVLALSGDWATSSGGAAQALVPGSGAAVTFDSTGAATNVTLGANMNFGNTTIAANAGAMTLNTDGYGLTVNGSLTVLDTSAVTLNAPVTVNGLINVNTTGATTLNAPLAGSGMLAKLGTGTLTISGTSTYSGPTNVLRGTLVLGPGAPVGATNVFNGATLQINAASSLPATAGSINLLAPPVVGGPATIATGPDYAISQAFLDKIGSSSNGFIAVGTGSANNLNFTNLPNMILGSTTAAIQTANGNFGLAYSGATLTPGGSTYRLGAGNGMLTIFNPVLVGSNALVVGLPYPVGQTLSATYPVGTVNLRAANTFSNGITINNGSTLIGLAQGSGSPFGAIANTVAINGGTLQLEADPVRTLSDTVGAVTAQGAATVAVNTNYANNTTLGNFITTLNLASVARTNQGTLFVSASGTSNVLGASLTTGPSSNVIVTTPDSLLGTTALTTGTMLTTPFAFSTTALADTISGFLTYNSGTTGFANVVPTRIDTGGASGGTTLATAVSTDLVLLKTANDTSLTSSVSIQALTINGAFAITSPSGTPTLTISRGGIVTSNNNNSIGTSGVLYPIVSFGAVEGIINTQGSTFTINSKVTSTAGGLTKTGTGTLALTNAANNDFTGLVTINQGTLTASVTSATGTDSLGNATNGIVLNGGTLSMPAFTQARSIALGAVGGRVLATGAVILNGAITGAAGTGPLVLAANNQTIAVNNVGNTYPGGTVIVSSGNTLTVTVASGSSLGTGDVDLLAGNAAALNLLGNENMLGTAATTTPSTARLNIDSGNTVYFKSAAPSIGSLEGTGNVQLGNTSTATTLTIGGNGLSTAFTGVISPFTGSSPSSLTKIGSGTLSLWGANTYTGTTTLSDGKLNVSAVETAGTSGPLGNRLANAAGSIVFNGGTLQYSAVNTFDYSGRFTTSLAQDYKVDTNGQNVTWATALTPFSGLGTLTKSGAGMLTLPVAETYNGATAVNGGTLRVTDSIHNTSSVTVNTNAVLELASAGGTALALSSAYTPVTNNGTLNVSSLSEQAGAISGTGSTNVTGNLTADSIVQGTLSIGAGSTVTIRETTGGAASPVPEPGTWVLIGTALLGWLAFRRRR